MKPRNFLSLFRQDATIALRNSLVWFMLFTAVLMVVMVRFALPDGWEPEQAMFWHDATSDQVLASALKGSGQGELLSSPEALKEAVAADRSAVGVLYTGSSANPQVTLYTNGTPSAERIKIIQATLEQLQAGLTGRERPAVAVETLRPKAEPIPRNLTSVPILLTFEVLIIGFMLVAVLMFQEKQEGSIRAFRISPGTVSGYVLSKTLVFTLLGVLYGTILILATMGAQVNWPLLLAAMVLGAAFYTLLGIILAVFFSNLSEWFIPGFTILVINFLPIISYAVPTFSPGFMPWIPSYYAVFGMGEILFPTGSSLTPMLLYLGIGVIVAYALGHLLVTRKLMKEGR